MAESVYVHIGAPKAGSSYLQKMLTAHHDTLSRSGFFLPLTSRAAQFAAAADLRGETWTADQPHTWAALAADVAAREGVAILSEELICTMSGEQVERMVASLAPATVHVVLCARDLGRQVPAEWQQTVRGRGSLSYADWLADLRTDPDHWFWDRQDPARVAGRWTPHLEAGAFHIVTLPPPDAASELLWHRFASVLGIDRELSPPEGRQNESLGLVESELLRRLNAELGDRFPLRVPYLRVVRDHVLRPALLGKPGTRRLGVPAESVDWITARARQVAAELAALSGVDVRGEPDDLAAHAEVVEPGPDEVEASELFEALMDAWVAQTEHERTRREQQPAPVPAAGRPGSASTGPRGAPDAAESSEPSEPSVPVGAPAVPALPAGAGSDWFSSLRSLASAYARTTPVRTVAVVGNAPMEPSARRAAAIDACDLVVRVNSFVLDRPGEEPCQGQRADLVVWSRLVKATPWLFDRYRERLFVLLEPMRMYGRPEVWPASWPADLGFVVARNDEVAIPLNEELGLPWREERLAPTSGTTAAWLAVRLFPEAEVTLTGFSFLDAPDQTEWEHQWGDSVRVGPEHRIAAEARLLAGWREEGRIRVLPTHADEEATR